MPLTADQHVVDTSKELVEILKGSSTPPGFRPAHAKGILLKGTFTPTPEAGKLSIAQHFNEPSTPVIVRFSDAGTPYISDITPDSRPNGFSIRFVLADQPRRKHTDIVAHSVDAFPTSTGDEALALFSALRDGTIEAFLGTHPNALAFVQIPKPAPESFATQRFFSVQAFKLIDNDDEATYIRYRIVPVAGFKTLSEEAVKEKGENYLFDGVPQLLEAGPLLFKLTAQIAEEGDVTDDSCVHWPEERRVVDLGTISLDELVNGDAAEQKKIIFDPIPRDVAGLEASADPLLEVRASAYLISGRERRAA